MATDRFGHPHAANLPYARGKILATTEDDFRKLQRAWAIIRERGPDAVFVFTGLEHSLPMSSEELRFADDELAPALYFEQLRSLALAHLGGSPDRDDVAVFNRMTGATLATHLTLVSPGDVVVGASAATAILRWCARRTTSEPALSTPPALRCSRRRSPTRPGWHSSI